MIPLSHVYHSVSFVCKCTKAEDVRNGLVIIGYDVRIVGNWDRVSRLDDVLQSVEVSRLDIVGYNWDRRSLWRHQCHRHFHCASNAVLGLLHVTFGSGGAWIEVLENNFF